MDLPTPRGPRTNEARLASRRPHLLRGAFLVQWIILISALLLVGVALVVLLLQQRNSITKTSEERLLSQVRLIDQNLVKQLDSVSAALDGILDDLKFLRTNTVSPSYNSQLKDLERVIPGVRTLLMVDASGRVRFSSREQLLGIDVSDREYFIRAKKEVNGSKLYIVAPRKGILGVYIINLVRTVIGPNGRFEGLAVASLDPDFFQILLSSALYAPDMWAAIAHSDGLQYLMVPRHPRQEGLNLAKPGSFFSRHVQSGAKENLLTGTVYATGENRMMAIHSVRPSQIECDKYLIVSISRDLEAISDRWKSNAVINLTLCLIFILLSVPLLLLHQRKTRTIERQIQQDEETIGELHDELNRFFELSLNLLCTADMDGRFRLVSRAWKSVLGYSSRDLNGARYLDFIHEDDRIQTAQAINELKGGNPVHAFVNRFRHKDGTYRWIEWHAVPYKNHSIYAAAQDITERRNMESEREELICSLQSALDKVTSLKGLIPICAWCKKIRDDQGYWQQVERYITQHSLAELTHGICPDCTGKVEAEMELYTPKTKEEP